MVLSVGKSEVKDNPLLKRWFNEYNRRFFKHRLPDTLVCWTDMKPVENGITPLGRCLRPAIVRYKVIGGKKWVRFKSDRPMIFISDVLWKRNWLSLARETLLHEMCHLALPARLSHGLRFQKEMLRIAKAGAFKGLW